MATKLTPAQQIAANQAALNKSVATQAQTKGLTTAAQATQASTQAAIQKMSGFSLLTPQQQSQVLAMANPAQAQTAIAGFNTTNQQQAAAQAATDTAAKQQAADKLAAQQAAEAKAKAAADQAAADAQAQATAQKAALDARVAAANKAQADQLAARQAAEAAQQQAIADQKAKADAEKAARQQADQLAAQQRAAQVAAAQQQAAQQLAQQQAAEQAQQQAIADQKAQADAEKAAAQQADQLAAQARQAEAHARYAATVAANPNLYKTMEQRIAEAKASAAATSAGAYGDTNTDPLAGIDDFVNDSIPGGWSTLAIVAGNAIGGPFGAAVARATTGAVKGETPGQILKGAALTFALSYGTQALSEALSAPVEQTQTGLANGTIQPEPMDPSTASGVNPPAEVTPPVEAPVAPDVTALPQPAAPATPEFYGPPSDLNVPDVTALPEPIQSVSPSAPAGEIQISDTGERFIVNPDGSTSPYTNPDYIQTAGPATPSVSIEPGLPGGGGPTIVDSGSAGATAEDMKFLYEKGIENGYSPAEASQLSGYTPPEPVAPTITTEIPTPVAPPIDPTTVLTPVQIAALGGTAAAAAVIASSGSSGAAAAADTAIATQTPVTNPVVTEPIPPVTNPVTNPVPPVTNPVPPVTNPVNPTPGAGGAPGGTGTAPGENPTPGGPPGGGTGGTAPVEVPVIPPIIPPPVVAPPVVAPPVVAPPVPVAPPVVAPPVVPPVTQPISTVPEQGKPPSLGENYKGNTLDYKLADGTPFDTSGLSAAQIAALLAAGYVLSSMPTKPSMPTRTPFPIPTYNGLGLVNPGVNPGFVQPAPAYGQQPPGMDQYYWGQHQYAQNMADLANLNQPAPSQPYGNPNAVNLGRLVTPEELGYPNAQSMQQVYGPGYQYNPAPLLARDQYTGPMSLNQPAPSMAQFGTFGPNTQAQQATGQGYSTQYGQGLNYLPGAPLIPVAPANR